MGHGWGHGYDEAERKQKEYEESRGQEGVQRFWLKAGQTKKILFLDDDPAIVWEHSFRLNGEWGNHEPCKVRNRIDESCAVCDLIKDAWPKMVGFHTVIELTPVTTDDGRTFCYQRRLFAANNGSKEKPGVLPRLKRLRERNGGRIRGLVVEATRSGTKTESVGDDFTVVGDLLKEDPNGIAKYRDQALPRYVEHINRGKPADKLYTIDKVLQYNPWVPFDYDKVIVPRSNESLRRLLTGHGYTGAGGKDKNSGGSGGGGGFTDDFAGGGGTTGDVGGDPFGGSSDDGDIPF